MPEGDEILEALRRVDETTLIFNPWGIGGRLDPSSSALFLSRLLARATLADDVPEDVRLNFERVRKLFLHGLLEYEFFSLAFDVSHLVLEGALRHRFVTYYKHEVPVLRDGAPDILAAQTFDRYYDTMSSPTNRGLRLNERRDEGLPRTFPDLFAWARRRRLLVGQRNIGLFGSLARVRTYVAHPERYRPGGPPEAIRTLEDVAEIINRLWHHDTEGGRLFPTPVKRRPRAAALSPDRTAAVTFGSLPQVPFERDKTDWTYAVFLAADVEELIDFDWESPGHQRFSRIPGHDVTQYPMDLLWGPGEWKSLVAVLSEFDDTKAIDAVRFLDRVFFIRVGGEGAELPRVAADVVAHAGKSKSATWQVICADFPLDAFAFVRAREASPDGVVLGANRIARLVGDERARSYAQQRLRLGPDDPA